MGPGCRALRDVRLGKEQNREVGLSQREHQSEEIFNRLRAFPDACEAGIISGETQRKIYLCQTRLVSHRHVA